LGLWLGRLLLVMGRVRVLLTGLPSDSVRHAQVVRAGIDRFGVATTSCLQSYEGGARVTRARGRRLGGQFIEKF
jgi:hypothetical protein